MAITSLSALNADLPVDFKVKISTDQYQQLIQDTITIACTVCKFDCKLVDVVQYEKDLDYLEQILAEKKTERVWKCNECKEENLMDVKNIKIIKYQQPFYTGFIPDPPRRKIGIKSRLTFANDFAIWFSIALSELESCISRYRTEYASEQELKEING